MKIAYGSDFHFEFMSYEDALSIIRKWNFPDDVELLVIAGDLHVGAEYVATIMDDIINFHKIPIVYVPGNHEYYGSSFAIENKIFRKINASRNDYHILLNDFFEFNGINIFGCMGNIDGSYEEINIWKHGALNDFHQIKDFEDHEIYGRRERTILNYTVNDHKLDMVITHTMPSPRCVAERYRGDSLNACFCNDWEKEIHDIHPKYWICGHTHDSFEMMIDQTKVLCNPMGYPHENKNWKWEFIEL